MNVLVTGGSSFIGKNLKLIKPDWIYISSKDCDLTDSKKTKEVLQYYQPEAILHLAAKVGGIKDNIENQADFYKINTLIDVNLLSIANELEINRVLSCLSTCAFPDKVEVYPFTEEDLFAGEPTITNYSYAMTKRMLHVASKSYRQQYGRNYSTFAPCNIYGPFDHFGIEKSHFVASMIHKFANAKEIDQIEFWGTGNPLRQQIYVEDLCNIIPIILERHNSDLPLIVAPNENLSIHQMIEALLSKIDKKIELSFNGKFDGQFRKDGSNKKLMSIIKEFEFTSFEKGIKLTYDWYLENR